MTIMIANSILLGFEDAYNRSGKYKEHPLKGLVQAIQIVIYFIGCIIIVAVLIDKSPSALLAGLGASAAVLMLVFKDSILGFVAGVMLSRNNMIRIGDWIQMPDGSANGTVEEISLNTVKVRNWDNTISTIPPYTLISSPFKNWRGMAESGGRRVDKMIYLDMTTVKVLTKDTINEICKHIPLMSDYQAEDPDPTNSQLYRVYITRYIKEHPVVAKNLDIIIAQRQPGEFGLPIEVYFFLKQKEWAQFEKIQSDIFDHLIAKASDFGLKMYQLPS
jgi:small-conductance mechanosensitive channel